MLLVINPIPVLCNLAIKYGYIAVSFIPLINEFSAEEDKNIIDAITKPNSIELTDAKGPDIDNIEL
jgi:hypothetical protein